jgi:hypothetical protein
MQVAALCNHPISLTLRAIKIAIHKCCSRAAWCVDASIQWAVVQSHHLPTTPADTGCLLCRWLTKEAVWDGPACASWHAPHAGPRTEHCAPWHQAFGGA